MTRAALKTKAVIPVWVALTLLAFGCNNRPTPEEPPVEETKPTLQIAAASDLKKALSVLAKRFTSDTLIEVNITFGASGVLAKQIQSGAPFDLFLAANISFVDKLAEDGHIDRNSVEPYARGKLVLAVGKTTGEAVQSLADLTRPEVKKIALANPVTAPYGAAGKQALERAGLWEKVSPKIVQAESVLQALQFVSSGNAEVGLVSSAISDEPDLKIVEVDPKLYDPIIQGLGVVSKTALTRDAEAFVRFLQSKDGQEILSSFGFSRPEPHPETPTDPPSKEKS